VNMSAIEIQHDIQADFAEKSVLGAIFLDPGCLDSIIFLEGRDFFSPRHQMIYDCIRYLENKKKPIDVVTVVEIFKMRNKMDELGGISYIMKLAESCPSAANVVSYARIVRSKALRRRGSQIGADIMQLSREEIDDDEEYFSQLEKLVEGIRPKADGSMRSFAETRGEYFTHLTSKARFIPTGFKQFDEWSQGLWPGWLFISAGRPSVGKTALALQRVINVAKSGPVLIWSQEMDENQVKDRMISNMTGIPYPRLQKKELSVKELGRIEEAYNTYETLPIYIKDAAGITIEEVAATAKQHKKEHGKLGMIVVDYLQIMKIPQSKNETRATAIGNVTTKAKTIARGLKCCFMMLSQMTRESDKDQGKKPTLAMLKESSSIEQDADVVEFLWHDPSDKHPEGKVIQQYIAKGRDIGINNFRLLFKGWRQTFTELEGDGR
jgi:replicative DNA helicase